MNRSPNKEKSSSQCLKERGKKKVQLRLSFGPREFYFNWIKGTMLSSNSKGFPVFSYNGMWNSNAYTASWAKGRKLLLSRCDWPEGCGAPGSHPISLPWGIPIPASYMGNPGRQFYLKGEDLPSAVCVCVHECAFKDKNLASSWKRLWRWCYPWAAFVREEMEVCRFSGEMWSIQSPKHLTLWYFVMVTLGHEYNCKLKSKTNKQKWKIPSIDENVEKFEALSTAGGNGEWGSCSGKHCGSYLIGDAELP